jgi:hypothetical protein
VTQLAPHIIANVAILNVPAFSFSFFSLPDSKIDTKGNVGLENVLPILTALYLDKESVAMIPHSENALISLHLAPHLIKLNEGDDVVLETWYVQHSSELDLLPSLAGECHDPTPLHRDDGTIAESYGALDRMVKL